MSTQLELFPAKLRERLISEEFITTTDWKKFRAIYDSISDPDDDVTKFATAAADRPISHLPEHVIQYDLLLSAARQRSIGLWCSYRLFPEWEQPHSLFVKFIFFVYNVQKSIRRIKKCQLLFQMNYQ